MYNPNESAGWELKDLRNSSVKKENDVLKQLLKDYKEIAKCPEPERMFQLNRLILFIKSCLEKGADPNVGPILMDIDDPMLTEVFLQYGAEVLKDHSPYRSPMLRYDLVPEKFSGNLKLLMQYGLTPSAIPDFISEAYEERSSCLTSQAVRAGDFSALKMLLQHPQFDVYVADQAEVYDMAKFALYAKGWEPVMPIDYCMLKKSSVSHFFSDYLEMERVFVPQSLLVPTYKYFLENASELKTNSDKSSRLENFSGLLLAVLINDKEAFYHSMKQAKKKFGRGWSTRYWDTIKFLGFEQLKESAKALLLHLKLANSGLVKLYKGGNKDEETLIRQLLANLSKPLNNDEVLKHGCREKNIFPFRLNIKDLHGYIKYMESIHAPGCDSADILFEKFVTQLEQHLSSYKILDVKEFNKEFYRRVRVERESLDKVNPGLATHILKGFNNLLFLKKPELVFMVEAFKTSNDKEDALSFSI